MHPSALLPSLLSRFTFLRNTPSLAILISAFSLLHLASSANGATPSTPELKTARSTAIQYYLSLPKDWSEEREWPILVTIDGSGHNFLGNCETFIHARKDRPFIIVTPLVSSNGNDPADAAGILEIVKEVQHDQHGQSKFFLTGFSAGGHPTWQIIFAHPELLAAAAPAAGNYLGRGVTSLSTAPERVQLPIHAFQGEQDPYLTHLNEQWEHAQKQAADAGYKNVSRTMVPKAGHNPFAGEIVAYFSTLLPQESK